MTVLPDDGRGLYFEAIDAAKNEIQIETCVLEDPQILEHLQVALQRRVGVRAIVDRGKYDALEIPKRRHSSRRFTLGCIASCTNSSRSDTRVTSAHGISVTSHWRQSMPLRCYPCPRTGVTHVSGRNTRHARGNDSRLLCEDPKIGHICARVIPGGLSRLRCEGKLAGKRRCFTGIAGGG